MKRAYLSLNMVLSKFMIYYLFSLALKKKAEHKTAVKEKQNDNQSTVNKENLYMKYSQKDTQIAKDKPVSIINKNFLENNHNKK